MTYIIVISSYHCITYPPIIKHGNGQSPIDDYQ